MVLHLPAKQLFGALEPSAECHLANHQGDFYLSLSILFLSSPSSMLTQTPRLEFGVHSWSLPPQQHQVNCKISAGLVVSPGIPAYGNRAANHRDVVISLEHTLWYSRGKHNSRLM